jgi:hypothetical protein
VKEKCIKYGFQSYCLFLGNRVWNRYIPALLFRTISAQPFHFFYESSCRILEGFVATKLSFASRHYKNSLFSVLSQLSRVWNLEFPTNSAAFHVVPSINFQKTREEQDGPSGKRTTLCSKEWEQIVTKELPCSKIYVPIHATSNGPDIQVTRTQ